VIQKWVNPVDTKMSILRWFNILFMDEMKRIFLYPRRSKRPKCTHRSFYRPKPAEPDRLGVVARKQGDFSELAVN